MRVMEPPSGLPLTLALFREAVHMSEDEPDTRLQALLAAAVEVVETGARRPLLPRVVEVTSPPGPWTSWWLPLAPVIALRDPPAGVRLERGFDEPRICRDPAAITGDGTLTLRLEVGHAPAELPQALVQAVILIANEWHEAGIASEAGVPGALSFHARALIAQRRYRRPAEVAP